MNGQRVEVERLVVEWGVAHRALPGEAQSGDAHLVAAHPDGVLLAVVDGLGHGSAATTAAELAIEALRENPGESVIGLVQRCHARLRETRGAVMSLAALSEADSTLTWIGVGNVEATIFRAGTGTGSAPAREDILLRPGLVGYQLSPLRAVMIPVSAGDVIAFATDGVQNSFKEDAAPLLPPQACADRILAHFVKPNDDALVLVARIVRSADGTSAAPSAPSDDHHAR